MAVIAKDYGLKNPKSLVVTESGIVKSGIGRLRGIMVNASSLGGTIEILDNVEDAIPVIVREFDTDTTVPKYYEFGDVAFGTGLYLVIGGKLSCTVIYF